MNFELCGFDTLIHIHINSYFLKKIGALNGAPVIRIYQKIRKIKEFLGGI